MNTPSLEIFGFLILEPMTTITDFILAAMSFYFGHKLFWGKNYVNPFQKRFKQYWAFVFLFLGFGSFLGGVSHGFSYLATNFPFMDRAWPLTVLSIGIASFYLFLSLAAEYFPQHRNNLFLLAYVKLMAFILLMFGWPAPYFGVFPKISFNLVILDYTPVMLLILALNIREYLKFKTAPSFLMAKGFIISILGTLVQMSGFGLHEHLNHNDIYHFIQMYAILCLYRAATQKQIHSTK